MVTVNFYSTAGKMQSPEANVILYVSLYHVPCMLTVLFTLYSVIVYQLVT